MRKLFWGSIGVVLFCFVLVNVLVNLQVYSVYHFNPEIKTKAKKAHEFDSSEKLKMLIFGANLPKAQIEDTPSVFFSSVQVSKIPTIHAWYLPGVRDTVLVLFHGYLNSKSSMLLEGQWLNKKGFSVLLVDFRGAGQSEGNYTSVGYYEAEDVKNACIWAQKNSSKNIVLYGRSMGAAAILRAMSLDLKHNDGVKALILECPFASMFSAIAARVKITGLPHYPFAHLVTFWTGIQGGFNAFNHNPYQYAQKVKIPALYLIGDKDDRILKTSTQRVFDSLAGAKTMVRFSQAKHQPYLPMDSLLWSNSMVDFLNLNEL